jgi:hypothetical protein
MSLAEVRQEDKAKLENSKDVQRTVHILHGVASNTVHLESVSIKINKRYDFSDHEQTKHMFCNH